MSTNKIESPPAVADGQLDVVLRPVRSGIAFEDTVERLLQLVHLGIVAPGQSLPAERDLALRLTVSRDTVRDAIRVLTDAGYLTSRRGRYGGTFVTEAPAGAQKHAPPVAGEIDDVLGLRDILEVGAAHAAASRPLSAADRDQLTTRLGESSAAPHDQYRRLDSRLHLTIGELAGIPSLVPLLADNRMLVNLLLDAIPLLDRNLVHSNSQHEAIVLAILQGDANAAADAMREHLEGTAALLHGFLA
ncbi:FadR/GntR family transcriptional regulator [Salinibacterium sp. ZJ450]|uniref:FadR/GntR family transcriptional regulator n=1 Tax=Salinibacterium sp. ZJ450 TaxID=2708338 RepID=UPI001CD69DDF|nr:FCD domain-containing protein [Salinibacterium sp. ZJ450]